MKIAFVVPKFFSKGRIFDENDSVSNRDDCLRPFIELKRVLRQEGVLLATTDELPVEKANTILCLNMPSLNDSMWGIAERLNIPVHVIALESEYIHVDNANADLIRRCLTIFTPRDDIVDNVKFFPIRFAQQFKRPLRRPWSDKKFACMVSGNKTSSHPDELYSRRLETIRWYDTYHPEDFDLFGIGWDAPPPSSLFMRVIRRLPLVRKFFAVKLKVYRGSIEKKLDTLACYRFCFCFENFSSPDGWITEKIFDAMFAGCVPVYWGPGNTTVHIPAECFIDASKLSTPEELRQRLLSLDNSQCAEIVNAIDCYLRSEQAREFSVDAFVNTISNRLLGNLGKNSEGK